MRYTVLFFLFLNCLLLACPAHAQPAQDDYLQSKIETREFDRERWKSLSEGIDYTSSGYVDENFEEGGGEGGDGDFERGPRPRQVETRQFNGPSGLGEFLKIGLIVLAILAVIFILAKLAMGGFGAKDRKIDPVSAIELEQIEENLEQAELDDPIRRAIASGDYPLAVRLYYLAMLQGLAAKSLIRWKRDKTNGEYLRELAGSPLAGTVREATLIFERVWYGKVTLRPEDFPPIETKMKNAVEKARTA